MLHSNKSTKIWGLVTFLMLVSACGESVQKKHMRTGPMTPAQEAPWENPNTPQLEQQQQQQQRQLPQQQQRQLPQQQQRQLPQQQQRQLPQQQQRQLPQQQQRQLPQQQQRQLPQQQQQQLPQQQQQPIMECYKADPEICAIELEILRLTNTLRSTPFQLSPKISYAARRWSQAQAFYGRISHAGFPRNRNYDYQNEFGESAGLWAENVAMHGYRSSSPQQVAATFFKMWRNSSGHLKNMLRDYPQIGIGVYRNARGHYYATQIFGQE